MSRVMACCRVLPVIIAAIAVAPAGGGEEGRGTQEVVVDPQPAVNDVIAGRVLVGGREQGRLREHAAAVGVSRRHDRLELRAASPGGRP